MKKIILLFAAMLLLFGEVTQAKDFSYPSPDKKWKVVVSCTSDSSKTKNGGKYVTHFSVTVAPKKGGTGRVVAKADFFDSTKDLAAYRSSGEFAGLLADTPAWSGNGQYLVYMLKFSEGISDGAVYVYDTAANKVTAVYKLKNEEFFDSPREESDYAWGGNKILINSNSFTICVTDNASASVEIIDGAKIGARKAIRYNYSFSGKQISKKSVIMREYSDMSG